MLQMCFFYAANIDFWCCKCVFLMLQCSTGRGRGSRRRWGAGASGALQQAAPPPQRPPQRIDAQPRRGTTISRRPTASDAAGTVPDRGTRSMASAPTPCHSPSRSLAATQPGRTFPTRGEDRGSTSLAHGRRTPK